jgi:hypothetical protein
MRSLRLLFVSLAIVTVSFSEFAAAQRETIAITGKAAACLVKHQRAYEAQGRDVMVIYLDLCPNVRPSQNEISSLNVNQSVIIRRSDVRERRRVLVVNRHEFDCVIADLRMRRNLAQQNEVPLKSSCIGE